MHKFTLKDLQGALFFIGRGHQSTNMGNNYLVNGQYCEAIECHSKALELAKLVGYREGIIGALRNLGCAYHSISQYQKAIDCYGESLDIAQQIGHREGIAGAFEHMAISYGSIGQYQKAINFHRKSLEITQKIGHRELMAATFGNMGVAYVNISQYQKAIDCHRKSLKILQELGHKRKVAIAFGNMGDFYNNIGLYQKAIDCHREKRKIAKEIGDRVRVSRAYGSMGNGYHGIGQYKKAIVCHQKHLEIAQEIGDRAGVRIAYGSMGNTYLTIGQYQKAVECHRKALEIAEQIGDSSGVASVSGDMGLAYHEMGQDQTAADCHRKHLEIAQEIGDIGGIALAQLGLGVCYRGNYVGLACSVFARSVLSFQSMRDSLIHQDEFNTSLASKYAFVHKFLFECLLSLNHVEAALLVADNGKAKALNDLTKRGIDVVMDTTSNYKYIFQTISEDPYSETIKSLFDKALPKVIHLMQHDSVIFYTFDYPGNLHAWVLSKNGVFHKQWHTANGMSTETYLSVIVLEVREGLFRDIPGYFDVYPENAGNNRKIKQNNVLEFPGAVEKHHRQKTYVRDLEARIQKLLMPEESRETSNHCRDFPAEKCVKERYSLDSALPNKKGFCQSTSEDNVATQMTVKKISGCYSLDVFDGSHSHINRSPNRFGKSPREYTDIDTYLETLYCVLVAPIEEHLTGSKVLIVPEDSLLTLPFAALLSPKNDRLCEKYSLQFTPALHILDFILTKPLPKLGAALFVGNPTVGNVKFLNELVPVSPLPNAALEAKECSKYFSAEPVLQENATKENVLNKMKDASIIHIAAHGHMDYADIFLAPNEGAPHPPNEEHYLLTAKDVLDCTLKARLVVLSCCHSGRGQISAEGVVGIARSFLGAGARSVLVTLWRIPDKETMEFMKLFYERVCEGLSVCVALQQAMIELKKKYKISAWASFQIVGEDIVLTQEDIEEIVRQSCLR